MMCATQANRFSLRRFWRERIVGLIMAQLVQGVTPEKIALTIALGVCLGVFPILGATSFLCAVAGISLRLNQPVIQFVNWLMSPVQLSLILVFVRLGERLVGAQPVSFSVPELIQKFHQSPGRFMREFGWTGVHGILAWVIVAPGVAAALYFLLTPPLKRLAATPIHHGD